MKCSMMAPRIAGLRCCQSPVDLVTEMKSEPKNTPLTPSMEKAPGKRRDAGLFGVLRNPGGLPATAAPGRNFRVAGLGVVSVWMNMSCLRNRPVQGRRWDRVQIGVNARQGKGRKISRRRLSECKPDNILDLIHDGLGDRTRAQRSVAQDVFDIAGIVFEPPHLRADRAELGTARSTKRS